MLTLRAEATLRNGPPRLRMLLGLLIRVVKLKGLEVLGMVVTINWQKLLLIFRGKVFELLWLLLRRWLCRGVRRRGGIILHVGYGVWGPWGENWRVLEVGDVFDVLICEL